VIGHSAEPEICFSDIDWTCSGMPVFLALASVDFGLMCLGRNTHGIQQSRETLRHLTSRFNLVLNGRLMQLFLQSARCVGLV